MEQMIVYQDRLNLHSEQLSLHVRDGREPKEKDFAEAGIYAVFPCDGERFEPFVEHPLSPSS